MEDRAINHSIITAIMAAATLGMTLCNCVHHPSKGRDDHAEHLYYDSVAVKERPQELTLHVEGPGCIRIVDMLLAMKTGHNEGLTYSVPAGRHWIQLDLEVGTMLRVRTLKARPTDCCAEHEQVYSFDERYLDPKLISEDFDESPLVTAGSCQLLHKYSQQLRYGEQNGHAP